MIVKVFSNDKDFLKKLVGLEEQSVHTFVIYSSLQRLKKSRCEAEAITLLDLDGHSHEQRTRILHIASATIKKCGCDVIAFTADKVNDQYLTYSSGFQQVFAKTDQHLLLHWLNAYQKKFNFLAENMRTDMSKSECYWIVSKNIILNSKATVELSAGENKILKILLGMPNQPIENQTLSEFLWQENVNKNKLSVYICKLRRKFKKLSEHDMIKTVAKYGYQFDFDKFNIAYNT